MQSQDPTDEDLASRSREGDLDAFRALAERYQTRIFRLHYQFLRDHQRAEDGTQETFVRVYRNLESFDPGRGRFSTWIYTIARNVARSALRKNPLAEPEALAEGFHEESPDQQAESRDVAKLLDRVLAEMPPQFQTAFILAEIEELPLAEVAVIEGVPIGTIKSRISRARARLRAAIESQHNPT